MQLVLPYLLFAFIIAYILQTVLIFIGTHRLNYPRTKRLQTISVLVALRDEETTVEACVNSLLKLDYPDDLLEIVLINDRSRDRTAEIIDALQRKSKCIKTLHITRGIPSLSGKANAIAQGIEISTGELVLVTDGDCRVPRSWAKTHASYYHEDVGLVGGFTLLDDKNDRTGLFGKIQSLDWAYLLSVGTGAMGFGLPLSVLGNNFSFRRAAYDEVGGYRRMGFTIIEDFALMKTLLAKTDWRVRYPIDRQMLVYSHPMPDLGRFYQQRKRWSAGGKEVGGYGKFLMFVAMASHLLATLLMATNVKLAILAVCLLAAADFLVLHRTTGLVQRQDLLRYFPIWQAFYFLYTIVFTPVLLLPTTVRWKEISYSWKLNFQLKQMVETGSD